MHILLITLSCFIFKNKVFGLQNCLQTIFNTLSIFLNPRKYLILCFEIMTASQMEKATMLLIYVYHNYCFLYNTLGYSLPTYKHVGNSYDV